MSVRIAHLSDLHFGRHFNIALWRSVVDEVERLEPHLIVVSGDLVDYPSPLHLLAARCELDDLADKTKADLIVVPGNHDIYWSGIKTRLTRKTDWFDRIFGQDSVIDAIEELTNFLEQRPGFTARCQSEPPNSFGAMEKLRSYFAGGPSFVSALPTAHRRPLVIKPKNASVLVACLDSNAPDQPIGFATGMVHDAELSDLKTALDAAKEPCLARIAVIHHHPLPIAFSGGRIVGAEPLMVLHNAGTVLSILAEHKFDLVLHGHKHKPQFARLDLSPRDDEGYLLAVAAAGSAAAEGQDERTNCFNFITIEDHGQIVTESVFYGGARAPNLRGKDGDQVKRYLEPLSSVKRRAHIRSREFCRLRVDQRKHKFAVTEKGDLIVTDEYEGLCRERGFGAIRRHHVIGVPPDGWFDQDSFYLDEASRRLGYRVENLRSEEAANRGTTCRFDVVVPDNLSSDAHYKLTYALGNSVSLTQWESQERSKTNDDNEDGSDEEWIGCNVAAPCRSLILELTFPPALRKARPYLWCGRLEQYPTYQLGSDGCADLNNHKFVPDARVGEVEAERLRYLAESETWRIKIDFPLVGYRYQLRWRPPEQPIDPGVHGAVLDARRSLLQINERRAKDQQTKADVDAEAAFATMSKDLAKLFDRRPTIAKYGVDLFVYESSTVALRPVLSVRSGVSVQPEKDYAVPLGLGIAGAAFQQRRGVPWAAAVRSPFVRPLPYRGREGGDESVGTILAIPIVHHSQYDEPQPAPWAAIGVLSVASESDGTRIADLCCEDPGAEFKETYRFARALAHAITEKILSDSELT